MTRLRGCPSSRPHDGDESQLSNASVTKENGDALADQWEERGYGSQGTLVEQCGDVWVAIRQRDDVKTGREQLGVYTKRLIRESPRRKKLKVP
jgi:hypothetical protein